MEMVTEAEIAALLRSLPGDEPRVVTAGNFATPFELLRILDATLERCRLFTLNPQAGWPRRSGLITETPFVGPGARSDPDLDYLPMRLSLVPRLFQSIRPPDAVLIQTSTPRSGTVSLGIEVNILPAAIEQVLARGGPIIAQVNPQMPHTRGDAEIDVASITAAIEVDQPLPTSSVRPSDDVADDIGERAASLVTDGCTIQVGIGQVPDATVTHLRTRTGLRIWSEMFSDGVLDLVRTGAVDPDAVLTSTFMFGSEELYAWADEHPRLEMRRTEVVNDPGRIASTWGMISINTALEVDLSAQANASFVHGSIYSGFGGQPDFVSGALHSPGGHAVIALRSWHEKTACSTIVPALSVPASSFQHSAVVTEHGIARLFGRSQRAQARLLIEEAADPRARPTLREAARARGLLRPHD